MATGPLTPSLAALAAQVLAALVLLASSHLLTPSQPSHTFYRVWLQVLAALVLLASSRPLRGGGGQVPPPSYSYCGNRPNPHMTPSYHGTFLIWQDLEDRNVNAAAAALAKAFALSQEVMLRVVDRMEQTCLVL